MVGEVVLTAFSAFMIFIILLPIVTGVMKRQRTCSSREYVRRAHRLIANGWKHVGDGPFFYNQELVVLHKSEVINMTRRQWRRFVKENLPIKKDRFKNEIEI